MDNQKAQVGFVFIVLSRRAARVCAIASLAALVGACSAEPSEKDIRAAVERQVRTASEQAQATFGQAADFKVRIHEVKKIGCEKTSQKNAYLCDVQTDVEAPIVGRQSGAGRLRVVKGDDGWIAMEP